LVAADEDPLEEYSDDKGGKGKDYENRILDVVSIARKIVEDTYRKNRTAAS
jgi:hypothetical protein